MRIAKEFFTTTLVLGLALSANAAKSVELSPFFNHPFDAVLVSQDPHGNMSTTETISDGTGHLRIETTNGNGTTISLYDFNNQILTTLKEREKVMIRSKVTPRMLEPDSIPKTNLKSLPDKVVNGHPCRGETYEVAGMHLEVWHGKDISDYTVKSISDKQGIKSVTELRSYKRDIPNQSVFKIPTSGYQITGLPL